MLSDKSLTEDPKLMANELNNYLISVYNKKIRLIEWMTVCVRIYKSTCK